MLIKGSKISSARQKYIYNFNKEIQQKLSNSSNIKSNQILNSQLIAYWYSKKIDKFYKLVQFSELVTFNSLSVMMFGYLYHIKFGFSLGIIFAYLTYQKIDFSIYYNLQSLKYNKIKKSGYCYKDLEFDQIQERIRLKQDKQIKRNLKKYSLDPQSWH